MANNVEKIKDRLGIVDVVGSYLKLNKAGINLKANCPFHNEKTPSFFISPDRGTYKCFGCGAGGDIFTFVEQFEGVDFQGALKILAERAGVELIKEDPKIKNEQNKLYSAMEETTVFFENNLKENNGALKYIESRGLKSETISKFRIGYAKNEWRDLYDFLKKKNFNDSELEKVGLIKKTDKGFYDRFRGRIIFPIFDNSGRVVAFSGRLYEDDGKSAKYLNSPETVLFNKSKILYGYNFARNDIRKRDFSILVEGQMDIIMAHQAGFTNTVATSGTALTSGHLSLLKRLSNKITMAFDGDSAGLAAANKGAKLALGADMEVKLVEIPENSDPADLILNDRKAWIESMKNSVHIIDFNLNILIKKEIDKRSLGLKIKEIVLPLVSELNSKIEKDHFVSQISLKTGISEDAIWEDLNSLEREKSEETLGKKNQIFDEKNEKKSSKKQKAIREVSGILYWQKSLEEPFLEIEKIKNRFKDIIGESVFKKIEELPENIVNEIVFEAENLYIESNNLEEKINELFNNLKKEILIEERDIVEKNRQEVNKKGEDENEYLKKISELTKKIESLNH